MANSWLFALDLLALVLFLICLLEVFFYDLYFMKSLLFTNKRFNNSSELCLLNGIFSHENNKMDCVINGEDGEADWNLYGIVYINF